MSELDEARENLSDPLEFDIDKSDKNDTNDTSDKSGKSVTNRRKRRKTMTTNELQKQVPKSPVDDSLSPMTSKLNEDETKLVMSQKSPSEINQMEEQPRRSARARKSTQKYNPVNFTIRRFKVAGSHFSLLFFLI